MLVPGSLPKRRHEEKEGYFSTFWHRKNVGKE
jgi:hypothetical protein